jgi:type IV pilus assembly protein PilV
VPATSRRRIAGGFALIEILVAILVFAVGMLGLAGLLLSTLRGTQTSQHVTAAGTLVRDYQELALMLPASAVPPESLEMDTQSFTGPARRCDTEAATCTPVELAGFMQSEWADRVATLLPGGRAKVCRDSQPRGAGGHFVWECDGKGTLLSLKIGWFARAQHGARLDASVAAQNGPWLVFTVFGNQPDWR